MSSTHARGAALRQFALHPRVPLATPIKDPSYRAPPPLGRLRLQARGPSLFRFEQRTEQKYLTAIRYASRLIEGYFVTPHRILGRVEYNVVGSRIDIRIPYFAPDASVPSDDDVIGLNHVLTALAQQQDPSAAVVIHLHRVRQPQLDAKMLACLIARNIPREGERKVLKSLPTLLPTVRPDAPLDVARSGVLPAYVVGWHVYVKGPLNRSDNTSVKFKASGGTISRGMSTKSGIMVDHGRCVQVVRPKGPFCVRVTLFTKRWDEATEWRDQVGLKSRFAGTDVRLLFYSSLYFVADLGAVRGKALARTLYTILHCN